jgi:hypothetical protein
MSQTKELIPAERIMGTAAVSDCRIDGPYAQVRLTLTDGRDIYFNHRAADLHDDAGRILAVGDVVSLFGDYRIPKGVLLGTRVLFRSDAWWAGPPPR